jgi:hypothetical protein
VLPPNVPPPPIVGQTFAIGLLAAGNAALTAAGKEQLAVEAFPATVPAPFYASQMNNGTADPHQVWNSFQEASTRAWQNVHQQLLQLIAARFTTAARWANVDQVPQNLGPTPPPTPLSGDFLQDASNFFAAWGDRLTFGLTAVVRRGFGYDDVIDYNSVAYRAGSSVGQLHNLALSLASPAALSGTLQAVYRGLQLNGMVMSVAHGVQALQNGDTWGAITSFMGVGLSAVRGVSACNRVSTTAQWLQRGLHGAQALTLVNSAFGKFSQGDWFGGFVDLADAGGNLYMMGCFAKGTPLLTPTGSKPIEEFRVGDEVLARAEDDWRAPVEAKRVEEVFVREAFILHLHVGGQVIRTTREHPFYVKYKGWLPASELQPADQLSTHDGRWMAVEEVYDTGGYETVYNLRVADHHTYFVGSSTMWGFSVWAHNAYDMHHGTPKEVIKNAPPHIDPASIRGKRGQPNRVKVDRDEHQDAHAGGANGGQPRYNEEFQRRLDNIAKTRPLTALDYWAVRARMLWEYFGI